MSINTSRDSPDEGRVEWARYLEDYLLRLTKLLLHDPQSYNCFCLMHPRLQASPKVGVANTFLQINKHWT